MEPRARTRVIKATLGALIVAILIVLAFVLPAEYGLDPLGIGRVLGLTQLAEAAAAAETAPARGLLDANESLKRDQAEFTLQPKQTVEYKYRLDKDATMIYEWSATAPVVFDFHTEPEGTASSASESFKKGDAAFARGAYVAPYNGIHGWYWENTGSAPLTITLKSAGFYYAATEFQMDGARKAHQLAQ